MDSLYEKAMAAIGKDAAQVETDTGRGKSIGSFEMYRERVGFAKGLRRAMELLKETATQVNREDDGG